jgi:biotin carboxyl carrier protein
MAFSTKTNRWRAASSPTSKDRVEAGQGIVVMEAMKMENELRATAAGTVNSVNVTSGTAVEKGALLVELY